SAEELLRELGHKPGRVRGRERPRRRQAVRTSLDDRIRRGIAWRRRLLVLVVLAYLVPSRALSAALAVAGMALFYTAQRTQRRTSAVALTTLLSFALLGGSL